MLRARCVLVCCCTVETSAQLHLVGAALPTPVHGHTGSVGPTAPRVLRCTISTLCAVLHCLVLCTALHLWAGGSGTPAVVRRTACGQWTPEILQCTATLLGGGGQWNSCNALPHCLGAVDTRNPAMHCHTALGQWAVELLQCSGSLPGGTGRPAQSVAAAHGAPEGGGSPQWRGLIGSGAEESSPTGGRKSRCA